MIQEIQETDEMKIEYTLKEMLEKAMDVEGCWRMENDRGIENLNTVAKLLGYKEESYLNGSAFERFLVDNPGCMETIIKWIGESESLKWRETLEDYMEEDTKTVVYVTMRVVVEHDKDTDPREVIRSTDYSFCVDGVETPSITETEICSFSVDGIEVKEE